MNLFLLKEAAERFLSNSLFKSIAAFLKESSLEKPLKDTEDLVLLGDRVIISLISLDDFSESSDLFLIIFKSKIIIYDT
jgi:hypothetical protein